MAAREHIGTALKSALVTGAWMRLAIWCKMGHGRELSMSLHYIEKTAHWKLTLTEGETVVFSGTSETLDGITFMAVSALGKSQ